MGLRLAHIQFSGNFRREFVPLVGLALFAGLAVFHAWSEASAARAVLAATDLAELASLAIHELQKERGMSSGFVASKGQQFSADLAPQRQAADSRIRSFQDTVAAFGTGTSSAKMAAALNAASGELKAIDPLRKSVSDLATTGGPSRRGLYADHRHAAVGRRKHRGIVARRRDHGIGLDLYGRDARQGAGRAGARDRSARFRRRPVRLGRPADIHLARCRTEREQFILSAVSENQRSRTP